MYQLECLVHHPDSSDCVPATQEKVAVSNPVAMIRNVTDGGIEYKAIMVVCPGCLTDGGSGLHMLPIMPTQTGKPHWDFSGNLEAPTLEPSILTRYGPDLKFICHSYLRNGVWEFLSDCTHSLANQHVPTPPLPDWVLR